MSAAQHPHLGNGGCGAPVTQGVVEGSVALPGPGYGYGLAETPNYAMPPGYVWSTNFGRGMDTNVWSQ